MNEREFLRLLDTHGPFLGDWPQAALAPATQLLARSPELREALDQAEAIDYALRSMAPAISQRRVDRLVRQTMKATHKSPLTTRRSVLAGWDARLSTPLPPRREASVMTALAALCFVIGGLIGIAAADARSGGTLATMLTRVTFAAML